MAPRRLSWLSALLLAPVVVIALWSDQVPIRGGMFLADLKAFGLRVEARLGFHLRAIDSPVPLDQVIHIVLWAAVGFVAHRLAAHRFTPVLIATIVLLASYLSELGQAVFTAGRSVEASDAVANAVGVGVGILFAQVLDWATRRRTQAER